MRALPLAAGINVGGHYKWHFGPSGVRALPLAAGINVVGHYKWHFGPSGVRACLMVGSTRRRGDLLTVRNNLFRESLLKYIKI